MNAAIIAVVFAICSGITVLFQLALAAGAAWGQLSMGGRFPGRFPPNMRFAALLQAALLAFLAAGVLARAGVAFPGLSTWSGWLVWIGVGFSLLTLALNLITPSKWERRLWAPVAFLMLASSLLVALA